MSNTLASPMFSLRSVATTAAMLTISVLFGTLGGAILGAAILSFANFIDWLRFGVSSYIGLWRADVWLGCLYGGVFGAMVAPIAYVTLIHRIGLRKALLPAATGTLIGGFVGALVGPGCAAFAGIAGFFIAIKRAVDGGWF
jgi:hypothetical protein